MHFSSLSTFSLSHTTSLHPKLAVWPSSNSYFLTFDTRAASTDVTNPADPDTVIADFNGVLILALDRANMLHGRLADARFTMITSPSPTDDSVYHGCLPSDADGYNVSPYRDELIVCLDPHNDGSNNELDVFSFSVDWCKGKFEFQQEKSVRVPEYVKACDE